MKQVYAERNSAGGLEVAAYFPDGSDSPFLPGLIEVWQNHESTWHMVVEHSGQSAAVVREAIRLFDEAQGKACTQK